VKSKKDNKPEIKGEKDHWFTYSLQQLSPGKFARVVNEALKGRYTLITPKKPDSKNKR